MEFIYPNYLNTTTQMILPANTTAAKNLITQDLRQQYFTSGFNDDLTTASITINFDATTAISRLVLLEHNLKDFTIFYNSSTANTFSITSTSATTTSDWTSNSETAMYLFCNTAQCTSITLDMSKTITADVDKAIGRLIISDVLLDFERVPSSKNYKPIYNTTQVTHKLSDGSIRLQWLAKKRSANIKYKHITTTFRNSLKAIYDRDDAFIFAAFPTSTAWDQNIFDAVWSGDFKFYRYSDDAVDAGFSGDIKLNETTL